MSLQVWLPLNKNVIENKGLSDVTITNNGATFADSGIESCYSFSGGSGINTNILVPMMEHSTCFSISFWMNPSTFDGSEHNLVGTTDWTWLLSYNNSSLIFRQWNSNGTSSSSATDAIQWIYGTGIFANLWNFITLTWDGNNCKGYINSSQVFIRTNTGTITHRTITNTSNFWLKLAGGIYKSGTVDFAGSISDFRIYDHALSDKEVAELAKGLMFHLKLDNTDLYDCSGYGWSVSKYSSGTLSENSNTARYSKSLTFDSTYITIPYLIKYDAQEFTVSYWIKYNTLTGQPIFDAHSSLYNGCFIGMGGDGTTWMIRFDTKQQNYSPGTYSIEANRWYHVTCVYKAGQFVKIYADDKYSTVTSANATSMVDANISYNQIGNTNFDGSISDFRIYRTALTDEQVAELYKVGGSIDNYGNAHCYELVENNYYDELMKSAYFYLPFKVSQSVIDVNNGISPSVNSGMMTNDGYYTDGVDNSGTYLTYTNTSLMSVLCNNLTIFLEVTPYELNRNQYLLSITQPQNTFFVNMISIFIYKTKNNKFGMTLYETTSSNSWLDNEVTNSPVISYGSNYKICLTYDRINGVLKVFINGTVSTYTNFYTTINPDQLSLGRHNDNTTRFAKATFKDFAIWDRILTDEECLKLTIL